MNSFVPALALLLFFQAPQTVTPPPATPAATEVPVYGPSHVQDDVLHLSFDLPDGVLFRKDLTDTINKSYKKKSAAGDACVSNDVYAFDPKFIRRIALYRYNGACIENGVTQERLRSTAARLLTALLHEHGKESMTSPIDYELSDHPAAVMSGNVFSEKNHGILFGEATCASIETEIACWTFISSTSSKVARLATMPVLFDGQKSVPIIPEDMSSFVALPTLTFHDDVRHIEFTYPGSFASSQPRVADAFTQETADASGNKKQVLSCIKPLLSADELTDTATSNILIYGFSTACMGLKIDKNTLRDFAVGFSKGKVKDIKKEFGKPAEYSLGDHQAVALQGKLRPKSSDERKVLESCAIVNADIICWQITSTSIDRLNSLAASTVSFDRGLGVPLMPKYLLVVLAAK